MDAWGLRPWGGPVNYERFGTWNEFLTGTATVAVVIVALREISVERRRAVAELDRLRDRETTQVFSWLTPRKDPSGVAHWYLSFENNTVFPVYEWIVEFDIDREHACGKLSGPVRPHTSQLFLPDFAGTPPDEIPKLILSFTDAMGRTWRRDEVGRLALWDMAIACPVQHPARAIGIPQREWTE
jgi:hypothetical protein